ncbi:hypothetical protein EJ04DRAFT_485339 [Polyplosphaeria fusca]|uniref:Uncharacterized protein n=1 Tax=Polyplosphaeria fusca TaxID=682080 RepID=A0A9P4R4L7_9PLEO|nr:hypothetical protein EJ04DRAFT_485339 [Polyplosphaeria fusca]
MLLDHVIHKQTPENIDPVWFREQREIEEQDRRDSAEFQRQKLQYEKLKRDKGGKLGFQSEVEWLRISSAENVRLRKRKREQEIRNQELNSGRTLDQGSKNQAEVDDDDWDTDEQGPKKRPKAQLPRKQVKQVSLQEAEYQSMRQALEAGFDLPKKQQKKVAADDPRNNKYLPKSQKQKAPKTPKPAKRSRKEKQKQQQDAQRANRQMGTLLNADVFRDQAAPDAAEQPQLKFTNKKDALKELITSLPAEKERVARTDMAAVLAASKDFDGHGAARSDGRGMWLVKGMKTSLKPYQLLGSAFMRQRENAMEEPRGGLLADQMGLGKTLMMLANIVNGKPPAGEKVRTTLLVASPSLLSQWESEIKTHTKEDFIQVMRYGVGARLKSTMFYELVRQHDVVLTTYTEVMNSYPKNTPPEELQDAKERIEWWERRYEKHRGYLHRVMWHRVVLDEAQCIKNHASRTSLACRALMAQHRWAISGTPILNNLTELFPYFKFLGVPHTGSLQIFKDNYCDVHDKVHTERLQARLDQFMIRRTHADIMFGAPILKLPQASQGTVLVDFNSIERNIYKIVHDRFVQRINLMAKDKELDRSYNNIFVLMLRLRQLTAHVLMLQFVMKDLLEREDIERITRVIVAAENNGVTADDGKTIRAVREQLKDLGQARKKESSIKTKFTHSRAEASLPDVVEELDDAQNDNEAREDGDRGAGAGAGNSFGREFDFKPFLQSLKEGQGWEKAKAKAKCRDCGGPLKNAWLTTCHHLICYECYETSMIAAAESGEHRMTCKCGEIFGHAEEIDAEGDLEDSSGSSGPVTRSKAKAVRLERENIDKRWLNLDGGNVLPSAKTIAIKAQILNWIQENKDVKIIIYTQFVAMIRILAKVCEEEGWGAEQYYGGISFEARERALDEFGTNDDVRVLLASLRCGGLGLNLTMASRVILIDPWWNSAAEQQAFCRVFRIGQKDKTFMTRICIRDTIDEHLMNMQKRKEDEINTVLPEEPRANGKKHSTRDLMRLFGPVREDGQGRPYILTDEVDTRNDLAEGAEDEDGEGGDDE